MSHTLISAGKNILSILSFVALLAVPLAQASAQAEALTEELPIPKALPIEIDPGDDTTSTTEPFPPIESAPSTELLPPPVEEIATSSETIVSPIEEPAGTTTDEIIELPQPEEIVDAVLTPESAELEAATSSAIMDDLSPILEEEPNNILLATYVGLVQAPRPSDIPDRPKPPKKPGKQALQRIALPRLVAPLVEAPTTTQPIAELPVVEEGVQATSTPPAPLPEEDDLISTTTEDLSEQESGSTASSTPPVTEPLEDPEPLSGLEESLNDATLPRDPKTPEAELTPPSP